MNILNNIYMLAPVVPFGDIAEGQAITILILGIAILFFQYLGLFTKYKIFLMVAVAGLIEFLIIWQDYPALIVGIIGLIIFNLYYAVFGRD